MVGRHCNVGLIPKLESDLKIMKFVENLFKNVERTTKLFEFIYSEICKFEGLLTRGGKK